MSNGKDTIIHLTVGLIRLPGMQFHCIKMSQYFRKLFRSFGGNSNNVKIYLSNYATKTDLKNITHIDTSNFTLKS